MSVDRDSESIDPAEETQDLNRIRFARALSRRNFVAGLGLAGAGALATACGGSSSSNTSSSSGSGSGTQAAGPSETDVLNFALNLEYLEASFYLYATTGSGLSSTDLGGSATVTGGAKVSFTNSQIADIAAAIAADEQAHVEFLRSALGSAAVACPAINLNALGVGFGNQAQFLTLARAFEDVGVSAYGGAAQYLTGSNLQAAAQILAVEAFHSGNIRLNVIQQNITVTAVDSLDIVPTEQSFFLDNNALAVIRTPSQVLNIVYAANGATGVTSGGFYPDGMNGNIKST